MLSTTCWLLRNSDGKFFSTKVFLRRSDAEEVLASLSGPEFRHDLVLQEMDLVLMFGCSDTKLTPESVEKALFVPSRVPA